MEPLYEFTKGIGWSLTRYQQREILDASNKHWLVIERPPAIGEVWDAYNPGIQDFEKYLNTLRPLRISSFSRWSVGLYDIPEDEVFVTIIHL